MNPRAKKIIIVSIILCLVILAGLTVNSLIPRGYLHFEVAPQQAAIMVDGKDKQTVTNGDTITVTPGKHTVVVFRDEFNPYSESVDLKNGQTADIIAALIGLTDSAQRLLNNDNSSKVIEAMTAKDSGNQVRILNSLYPILGSLPIENRNYTVTSCPSEQYPNNPLKIALCVSINDISLKEIVKQDINNLGYNADSYEYVWFNNFY